MYKPEFKDQRLMKNRMETEEGRAIVILKLAAIWLMSTVRNTMAINLLVKMEMRCRRIRHVLCHKTME